jgi:dihydrofolate reductase
VRDNINSESVIVSGDEMGKIIVFMNLTLDGAMQAPARPDEDTRDGFKYGGWAVPYAAMPAAGEVMSNCGAMLFGRKTYEDFYDVWHKPDTPFTKFFANIPKYVASTTLDEPLVWEKSTLLKGDIPKAVEELKKRYEKTVIMGSGELVRFLMKHNLIDEYALLIHPIILGEGKQLFERGVAYSNLKLVSTKATDKGVILAIYEPIRNK